MHIHANKQVNSENTFFTHKSIRALTLAFIIGFVPSSIAALLAVVPGFLKIDAIDPTGITDYDAGTFAFSVNALPTALTFKLGDAPEFVVDPRSVNINIAIDSLCDVVGNNPDGGFDLEVTGDVYDQNFTLIKSGVLLTGDIVEMGQEVAGAPTSKFDFRFTNAGGQLVTDGDWPLDADIGVTLTSENSNFTGDCSNNFSGGAKVIIGPLEPVGGGNVCDISIVKTASPDVLGPFAAPHNFQNADSDSDSGKGHKKRGDSDDSDSDSADSDAGTPACGCKGRIEQLTLRYNRPNVSTVEVRGKKGSVLFGPSLLQPGEEFTFAVKGKKIKFLINTQKIAMIKTGCKHPIGAGQEIGANAELVVVSGLSKFRSALPLCPLPGTTCSADHEVTYTYDITNNGTDVTDVMLLDDQLGVVGGVIPTIPAGGMVSVQTTACIFTNTINKAVAIGLLGDGVTSCESNEAQETVTVEMGDCPRGSGSGNSDSDSDSGIDSNLNGDTDDSDSDSGKTDCDKDEPRSCFGGGHDTDSDSGRDTNKNGDTDDSDSDSGKLECDVNDSDSGHLGRGKRHRKGWGWW